MTDIIPQDATPRKRCSNPECHQRLPATPEFFSRDRRKKDGLRTYCKGCETVRAKIRYATHHPHKKQEYEAVSEGMKRCCKCKNVFPATVDFFHSAKDRPDGLYPQCKECRQQYNARPDVRANKDTYNHAYYGVQENRDRILAQRKDDYHNNPEIRQQALDYNKLPSVRTYQQAYLKEYNQRPEGKEKRRVSKHTYRAREKTVTGTHTAQQIQDLLKRQKHKCYYCHDKFEKRDGKYIYAIEHTFPISRVAGTDIPANDISYLVLACPTCNRDKGDKFPWEWPKGGRLL